LKIFALADLHLSHSVNKPMCVFGPKWHEHFLRIERSWQEVVGAEDVVLISGDISWAMKLEEAKTDLDKICALPGKKVLIRGNHDYWWNSLTKVRDCLDETAWALQNDSVDFGQVVVGGTRGWMCPGSVTYLPEHEKLYQRELARLELSLKSMAEEKTKIVMLHYPPCNEHWETSGFMELLERYRVDIVVYGHLHGKACNGAFQGQRGGVNYHLTSADYLDFKPRLIYET